MIKIKILSITAQKPFATGSGIYLCELVKGFEQMGHEQAIIYGGDSKEHSECQSLKAISYKVSFNCASLPFPVFGMSDNMPYKSSKYKDMTKEESRLFRKAFEDIIKKADEEFDPDLVICHHLYYLSAIAINALPNKKVVAICHGTCLRQMENHFLEEDFIKSNIAKAYKIFALQNTQAKDIAQNFKVAENQVIPIGMGYNHSIFFDEKNKKRKNKIVYAGKLSPSKGIKYLIKSLEQIDEGLELYIAGDGNNRDFINDLNKLAKSIEKATSHKIYFLGRLDQYQLSDLFRKCEIFVLPSFYEGLPLVIIEAIACGLKIVYSNIEGSFNWFCQNFDELCIEKLKLPGSLDDENKADFDEESFAQNIATSLIKSRESTFKSQKEALEKLRWESLCDKIVKEIGENL